MATSSKQVEYSENLGLRLTRGVRVRRRGFPNVCRCGEEVLMRTSGTEKNPGHLFHACPYGSELEKYHFFKWTDLSMVEEIEDMKKKVEILEVQRRSSEEVINCIGKEMENLSSIVRRVEKKIEYEGGEKNGNEIVGHMPFFKKLICCIWA